MENGKFQELVLQQLQALTEGQAKLTEGQTRLESKVDGLESKVDGLESKVDGLESKVDGLESKVDKLEKGLQKLETRMENEVIDKIRVLFDAWQVHEDKLEDISNDTRYLVARVATLERLAK